MHGVHQGAHGEECTHLLAGLLLFSLSLHLLHLNGVHLPPPHK